MAFHSFRDDTADKNPVADESSKNPTSGRAVVTWSLFVILAVLNGLLREKILIPMVGDPVGQVLSGLILCALILGTTWLVWPQLGVKSWQTAWGIGAAWLAMTVTFEFLAGHFLFQRPWEDLFAAYDLGKGSVWISVLLVTLLAPAVTFRLRGERAAIASR